MASLSDIRDELKSVIVAGVPDLIGYDTVPDVVQVPAIVICPEDADFSGAMARGLDTWIFHLYVLVGRTETREAQESLDRYISGDGPASIRRVLFGVDPLTPDGTQVFVTGVKGYGGAFQTALVPHVGAILTLKILTPGGG